MKREKMEIKGSKGGEESRQADLSWERKNFSKRESVGKLISLLGAFRRKMNNVIPGGSMQK